MKLILNIYLNSFVFMLKIYFKTRILITKCFIHFYNFITISVIKNIYVKKLYIKKMKYNYSSNIKMNQYNNNAFLLYNMFENYIKYNI